MKEIYTKSLVYFDLSDAHGTFSKSWLHFSGAKNIAPTCFLIYITVLDDFSFQSQAKKRKKISSLPVPQQTIAKRQMSQRPPAKESYASLLCQHSHLVTKNLWPESSLTGLNQMSFPKGQEWNQLQPKWWGWGKLAQIPNNNQGNQKKGKGMSGSHSLVHSLKRLLSSKDKWGFGL